MMQKYAMRLALSWLLVVQATAQEQSRTDLSAITREVTGESGSTLEKTQRLVTWINTNFKWSYTDYQKRTVDEIVSRRAGNCAELANVLTALLNAAGIRSRWVAEINVHPRTEARQKTAEEKVAQWGKRGSVFGLRHNDHRWLEVYEESDGSWFPADPAVGVVGTKEWVAARLGFANRPVSPVPEIAAISKDMIVPFVVVALEARGGKIVENRSQHYLIEAFDLFYNHKVAGLSAWPEWRKLIGRLSALGASTFAGEVNLHEHAQLIEELARVYEKLKAQAAEQGLVRVQLADRTKLVEIEEALKLDIPRIFCLNENLATGAQPKPEAFSKLAQKGFRSVLSLRTDTEGVDLKKERELAEASGMRYLNIPVVSAAPDPKHVDEFIHAVQENGNYPMLLYCGSANRVAAFWMIYRVMADGWTEEEAKAEAVKIGLTKPELLAFAQMYLAQRAQK